MEKKTVAKKRTPPKGFKLDERVDENPYGAKPAKKTAPKKKK